MSEEAIINREIDGKTRSVKELLGKRKYSVDYYQREYKWQEKHIQELVDDLAERFLADFDPAHERSEVERYGHYFLGSVIVSHKNGQYFIIDGQQRMTSLTLLLIYLNNLQRDRADKVDVSELISSTKFGKRSFNLDVEERNACMEALFSQDATFDVTDAPESVRTLHARHGTIEECFPDQLKGEALPYFIDWLTENVHLVEIVAYSDSDAYTIFETMNDRGLSLTPTEMLKGYLLANITDEAKRVEANAKWKERTTALDSRYKEADADAIKAWLRSQWAADIRERKKGARPRDWDRIGTEFHRWLRENKEQLGLKHSTDFHRLVVKDFEFYVRQYQKLTDYSSQLTAGYETLFYNAQNQFTLQFQLLLAPLLPDDEPAVIGKKVRVVGRFLDILLFRRIWNYRAIDYSTLQYRMFVITREIRAKPLDELVAILKKELDTETERFATRDDFALHMANRRPIVRLLARLTDYVEAGSGQASNYLAYTATDGRNRFEVEHIWADKFERHTAEFQNVQEFRSFRNRIGGLLLLPKSFNASYNALPYEEKLPYYLRENWLAASLHPTFYQRNPGFQKFCEDEKLCFEAHPGFSKADQDKRLRLYQALCDRIWNPTRLDQEARA
jgi:uncharacterized protein with ParB-like and HNH nuclease domain